MLGILPNSNNGSKVQSIPPSHHTHTTINIRQLLCYTTYINITYLPR